MDKVNIDHIVSLLIFLSILALSFIIIHVHLNSFNSKCVLRNHISNIHFFIFFASFSISCMIHDVFYVRLIEHYNPIPASVIAIIICSFIICPLSFICWVNMKLVVSDIGISYFYLFKNKQFFAWEDISHISISSKHIVISTRKATQSPIVVPSLWINKEYLFDKASAKQILLTKDIY